MEKIHQILAQLEKELKKKNGELNADGQHSHWEFENGTYSAGYMQCLIDIYKKLRKVNKI
jgi:hypothetical protein